MKINIFYSFTNQPWGGGNQFLKALKKELIRQGVYEEDPKKAEAVLFNSHHNLESCVDLKQEFPEKIIIYRVDGPISLLRSAGRGVDKIIKLFSKSLVDGIIFQSKWSKEQNKNLFDVGAKYETLIYNATDNSIFNMQERAEFNPNRKIRLISTSWSPNWRKGFGVYEFLDKNIDFSKYEMIFVGNAPLKFKNIKYISPLSSEDLATILKQQDIYITASQNDPCSNSLIEAASCGLPMIALEDGGHPELVGKGGELFHNPEEIMDKIKKILENYNNYQNQIPVFSMQEAAQNYYRFAEKIWEDAQNKKYKPRRVTPYARANFYKMKIITSKKAASMARVIRDKLWVH